MLKRTVDGASDTDGTCARGEGPTQSDVASLGESVDRLSRVEYDNKLVSSHELPFDAVQQNVTNL